MTASAPFAYSAPGHAATLVQDTARMWTLTCECGWVKTWAFRTPLLRWHHDHITATKGHDMATLREILDREAREDAAYWLDRTRCAVCGKPAEVWLPDGEGDQVPYCGLHESAGLGGDR